MAELIKLKTFTDDRGSLTVIEKVIPFEIKRVYYIYNVGEGQTRAHHRHKKTIQAAICVSGECEVLVDNGKQKKKFILDSPDKCLILQPEDYHIIKAFKKDSVLLMLASEYYDKNDYINESY